MKHFAPVVFFLLVFIACHLQAQTADRPTISAGGGFVSLNTSASFQSTVGEVVTPTFQFNGLMFTQGFQQIEQIIDIPIVEGGTPSDLVIYPNPAADQVKVRFSLNAPAQISFILINNAGQVIQKTKQSFSAGLQEFPFDFRVAPGLYLLTLSLESRTLTAKVIIQ